MYIVCFIIFYCPIINKVNEFWIARRGIGRTGYLAVSPESQEPAMLSCIETLLQRYGYPTTLRAFILVLTRTFDTAVERASSRVWRTAPQDGLIGTSSKRRISGPITRRASPWGLNNFFNHSVSPRMQLRLASVLRRAHCFWQ